MIKIFTFCSFISEPQKLIKYLNEEELQLDDCDNTSVIETNFEPNKIILGYFGSNYTTNQLERHLYFYFSDINLRLNFLCLVNSFYISLVFSKFLGLI